MRCFSQSPSVEKQNHTNHEFTFVTPPRLRFFKLGKSKIIFLISFFRWHTYPGCQSLFWRGFRFLWSLYSDPREKLRFAARSFGLRPKTCRPSANTENSRRTQEKPLVPRVLKWWNCTKILITASVVCVWTRKIFWVVILHSLSQKRETTYNLTE